MALEKEIETYNRELAKLTDQEGKFVVIQGDSVIGIYVSYEDALKLAYEKCGLTPFLVKKIQSVEQVQFFSRDLSFEPCLTSA
ncbi:MAG: hypothetical protein ACLQSR_09150 [Limisphaerales bacterium]